MKKKTFAASLFFTLLISSVLASASDKIAVLHAFTGGSGGGNPAFSLVADSAGNLYGTTFWGGNLHGCSNQGCGVAYRLTLQGNHWSYTELYQFPGYQFGAEPTNLVLDSAGNLYGEMTVGGPGGYGLVFELSPASSGPWTFTTLHDFTGGADGDTPVGGLTIDSVGNLYGAAHYDGCTVGGCSGNIFEMSPSTGGGWTKTVVHAFTSADTGQYPIGGLVFDAAGNLYGTTGSGGSSTCDCGTVFQLVPGSGGSWAQNVLYTFDGTDGEIPQAGVALGAHGELFGTTVAGGLGNNGVVYRLSPGEEEGTWNYALLYDFTGGNDGGTPYNTVTIDGSGNLYGAALSGADGWGVVYEISHSSFGWIYHSLHTFTGGADGGYPNGLLLDASGNLYGVANYGDVSGCDNGSGCGTAFKLSPLSATQQK